MKKVLIFCIILTHNLIYSQENIVKFNPVALAFNGAEISYESKTRENQSFEIVLAFASFKNDLPDYNYRVYGAEARYKFYLLSEKRNF